MREKDRVGRHRNEHDRNRDLERVEAPSERKREREEERDGRREKEGVKSVGKRRTAVGGQRPPDCAHRQCA